MNRLPKLSFSKIKTLSQVFTQNKRNNKYYYLRHDTVSLYSATCSVSIVSGSTCGLICCLIRRKDAQCHQRNLSYIENTSWRFNNCYQYFINIDLTKSWILRFMGNILLNFKHVIPLHLFSHWKNPQEVICFHSVSVL